MDPLLIGTAEDTHFREIDTRLRDQGLEPICLDADSCKQNDFSVGLDSIELAGRPIASGSRGWLRRIAPSRFTTGVMVGSIDDVVFRSRVQLIASLARTPSIDWLTTIDAMQTAEDRLFQLRSARSLGIPVPNTVVSSDPVRIAKLLGDEVVVKPLSGGAFVDKNGHPMACLLYTSPSPRDRTRSRMPSSA